jgi:hypothetical protein
MNRDNFLLIIITTGCLCVLAALAVFFLLPSKRPSGKEMMRAAGVAAAHGFSGAPRAQTGAGKPETPTAAVRAQRDRASARRARIQFERDIALAEAEADGAHEILKQTNARSEDMSAIGYANFSAGYVDEQSAALAKAANNLIQKTRRVDFLRAEAARLNVPIFVR